MHDTIKMEKLILNSLKWQIHPPTYFTFIEYFIKLLCKRYYTRHNNNAAIIEEEKQEIKRLSLLQAEAAVYNLSFSQVQPSFIAIASILNSIQSYDNNDNSNNNAIIAHVDKAKQMFSELLLSSLGANVLDNKGLLNNVRNNLVHNFENQQQQQSQNKSMKKGYYVRNSNHKN